MLWQLRLASSVFPRHAALRRFADAARRPLSPHLSIYQPQLTWYMSIAHRLTGTGLAVAVYGFGAAAAVAPRDLALSAELLRLVQAVPAPLFVAGKAVLAAPFTFHVFNGIRHLVWDAGWALTLRGVYVSGYAVQAATFLGTAAFAFWA
jgi:succinate dehydrogenase (ubiquinone) cytochrome b560 subunit